MAVIHKNLTGDEAIHEIMYVQSSDPGAVGANKFWLDTTGGATLEAGAILKQRNGADSAWTTRTDLATALGLRLAKASNLSDLASASTARTNLGLGTAATQASSAFAAASHTHAESDITNLVTDLAAKAPLASPALTGNPTAPTQATGNNTTRLATTAFVQQEIAAAGGATSIDGLADVDTVSTPPSVGDALVWDGSNWVPGAGGGGGGGTRASVSKTTASLANNATETSTVTLAKASALIAITADRACRVVLYQTAADRSADASRLVGTPPTPGTGILAEFVFTGSGTFRCGPVPFLANGDGTPATSIYYAITNRSGATHTVQVDFLHLPLES